MQQIEPITTFLKRRLREAGASRFEAIASVTGVTSSFIRKFAYGSRENPRVQTIQPLLDFFAAVDRGERQLPEGHGAAERVGG
jgi:transcriptional regulator with XRE-family HTH domain